MKPIVALVAKWRKEADSAEYSGPIAEAVARNKRFCADQLEAALREQVEGWNIQAAGADMDCNFQRRNALDECIESLTSDKEDR